MDKIIEIIKRPEVIEILVIVATLVIAKIDKSNTFSGIIKKLAASLDSK